MRYLINDVECSEAQFISAIEDEVYDFTTMYSREVVSEKCMSIISSLLKDKCVQLNNKLFKIKMR